MILILPNGVIRRGWTGPKSYLAEGSSLFTEEAWANLVGTSEDKSFEELEAQLIADLGLIDEECT